MQTRIRHWVALLMCTALIAQENRADERNAATEKTAAPASTSAIHKARAAAAQREAVELAAESLEEANRLDLDIRLIGPTSVRIAGDY